MMTYDKQNENFLKENNNNKTIANTIICHTTANNNNGNSRRSNSKQNKFNKTNNLNNTRTKMMNICSLKAQPQQQQQQKIEQEKQQKIRAQIGPKSSCTEQTIIRKVFKQEISTMPQQANQKTHMTLKEYFEFSNDAAAINMATITIAAAKITKASATKRTNKQKYVQQKEQNREQKIGSNKACVSTINFDKQQRELMPQLTAGRVEVATPTTAKTNITEPAVIVTGLATSTPLSPITLSSLLSSSPSPSCSSSSSIWESLAPAKKQTPSSLVQTTTLANATDIDNDENSQSKIQQCNNVCISSKFSSKQKCMQHKKQQQHCKSANVSCNQNNSSQTYKYINSTKNDADEANTANNTTTTNKANIISYTETNTTTTNYNISKHFTSTANTAAIAATATKAIATRPIAISTTVLLSPLPPLPAATISAFSLRQLLKNTKQLECLLRAAMFSFVFTIIMSMQFQTVTASSHEPMFISRSETFKFVAGDTIILPCEVANTDPYVVAWKRGIAILTAGSVKVTPDPRVRLVNGFNLQIRDAVPQDAGDYICQIATMEPREITHTVEILVPPRIHHISTSGHLQVKKGSSVRIECSASGNPTPNVTWSRKNNILPNGEEKLHSHILSIENVDRHKGGVYICTANNGVGQPASSQVVLHVLYPPEITVERPVVFSGEGHEAMLVCIVHGETQPEVIWFKDTMQLDTTERHIMENRGSRHTLIIRKVHPQDFGNYSCVAENQLGKSRKTLQLSGKPNVAVFNSPPISQYKDRYNISWTVESHTPIEEYKLSFRRLQQGQEVDNSIDTHSAHSSSSSSSMLQMYGSSMSINGGSIMGSNAHNYRLGGMGSINSMMGTGGYGSYGAGNVIHWGRNDWRDVVLPAIPTSHHYTQGMSYMIRGLDPDQHYEATVQARNRYGWSDYSQSFVFSTSSNDNEMRDLSVTFYGSKATRGNTLGILLYVTTASLCLRHFLF